MKCFNDQVFCEIKEKCLSNDSLFTDDTFSINDPNILFRYNQLPNVIEWKRATEFVENAQLFEEGVSPYDIDQGLVGDCWFIAASIAVTKHENLIEKVIPDDQSFNLGDYCGAFHFHFWRFGEWLDVVVDDYLPYDAFTGELLFCKNKKYPNEFWCSLLEKAYAKLNGCYEFIDGGFPEDGIIDLTGGVDEFYFISDIKEEDKNNFWNYIAKALKFNSMIGACIVNMSGEATEDVKKNGLVIDHAYAVSRVIEIESNKSGNDVVFNAISSAYKPKEEQANKIRLLRVRNPLGGGFEWNGKFSDLSAEWNKIPDGVKDEIMLHIEKDGEFWIPYEDFLENFQILSFVHIDINSFGRDKLDEEKPYIWSCASHHGRIETNESTSLNIFPQYYVHLKEADEKEKKATLIVSLMQKDFLRNREKNSGVYGFENVNIQIFKVIGGLDNNIDEKSKVDLTNSSKVSYIGSSESSQNRSVSVRFRLEPGDYVIVPSNTYDVEVNFLLRIFTEFKLKDEDMLELEKPVNNDVQFIPSLGSSKTSELNQEKNIPRYIYRYDNYECKNKSTKDFCSVM